MTSARLARLHHDAGGVDGPCSSPWLCRLCVRFALRLGRHAVQSATTWLLRSGARHRRRAVVPLTVARRRPSHALPRAYPPHAHRRPRAHGRAQAKRCTVLAWLQLSVLQVKADVENLRAGFRELGMCVCLGVRAGIRYARTACVRTHACARAHMHAHARTVRTHTHSAHAHTCMHACTVRTHTHSAHAHTCMHACAHIYACTHTYARTRRHEHNAPASVRECGVRAVAPVSFIDTARTPPCRARGQVRWVDRRERRARFPRSEDGSHPAGDHFCFVLFRLKGLRL